MELKNKFNKINVTLKRYKEIINHYESLKKDIEENIENVQNVCNHDLILAYGYDLCGNVLSNCLICNKHLCLNDNYELFSEKQIDKNRIIDIKDKLSNITQMYIRYNSKNIVLYAQDELRNILNNENLNIEEIKQRIYNKVIEYDNLVNKERISLVKKKKI